MLLDVPLEMRSYLYQLLIAYPAAMLSSFPGVCEDMWGLLLLHQAEQASVPRFNGPVC